MTVETLIIVLFFFFTVKEKIWFCIVKPSPFPPKSHKGEILLWLQLYPAGCNLPHCKSTLWVLERLVLSHAVLWMGSQLLATCACVCGGVLVVRNEWMESKVKKKEKKECQQEQQNVLTYLSKQNWHFNQILVWFICTLNFLKNC